MNALNVQNALNALTETLTEIFKDNLSEKTAKKAKDENALASKGPVPETPEKPSSLLTKEKKPEKKLEKAPEKTPDKKTKEKPQEKSKDKHKFLGGLRKIFKKDRNSL